MKLSYKLNVIQDEISVHQEKNGIIIALLNNGIYPLPRVQLR